MNAKQLMSLTKAELVERLLGAEAELKETRDNFRNPKGELRDSEGKYYSFDSIYKEGYQEAEAEAAQSIEDYNEWFADINELVGCPRDSGGAVTNVEHYVRENKELTKKSNAKSDIIRNMFDCIIKYANIDDGFYIHREWGHKYIDDWNDIVSIEIKEAIKDINEDRDESQYDDEWVTDGYQFDLNIKDEVVDDEDDDE